MCNLWCASYHISRARECIRGMRRDQQIKQIAHKQIDDQSLAQDLMELAAARIINLLIKLLSACVYIVLGWHIEAGELFQLPTFLFIGGNKAGRNNALREISPRLSLLQRGLCADGNFPSFSLRGVIFVCLSEKESVCVHFYLWSEEKVSCVRACGYNFCYRQL